MSEVVSAEVVDAEKAPTREAELLAQVAELTERVALLEKRADNALLGTIAVSEQAIANHAAHGTAIVLMAGAGVLMVLMLRRHRVAIETLAVIIGAAVRR